jgi:hypothetical protein
MGLSFAKNHKLEVDKVNRNKVINEEITQALHNGTFKPEVKNWPNYRLTLKQKTKTSLTNIVESWLRHEDIKHQGVPTVMDIKREFYPKEFMDLIEPHTTTESNYIFPEAELELLLEQWDDYDTNICIDQSIYQEAVNQFDDDNPVDPIYVCFTCRKNNNTDVATAFLGKKKDGDDRTSEKKREDFLWDTTSNIVKDNVLHAAISPTPDLKHALTYHNKSPYDKTFNGDKDGFREQDFLTEYDHDYEGIIVFVAFVKHEAYDKLIGYIDNHRAHKDESKYNWGEIFARFFKKSNKLKNDDYSWMCSSFVNAVLVKAGIVDALPISKSPTPSDIKNRLLQQHNFKCVYIGPANKYDKEIVRNRTDAFADEKYTSTADTSNGKIIGPDMEKPTAKSDHIQKIRNYFLYSQPEVIPPSDELTAEKWETLLRNITLVGNTFESELKNITKDNEVAADKLQSVVNHLQNKIDQLIQTAYEREEKTDEYNRLRKQLDRNRILLQAVNEISREYSAIYASVINTDFFKTQYRLYRDVVSLYKSQK